MKLLGSICFSLTRHTHSYSGSWCYVSFVQKGKGRSSGPSNCPERSVLSPGPFLASSGSECPIFGYLNWQFVYQNSRINVLCCLCFLCSHPFPHPLAVKKKKKASLGEFKNIYMQLTTENIMPAHHYCSHHSVWVLCSPIQKHEIYYLFELISLLFSLWFLALEFFMGSIIWFTENCEIVWGMLDYIR